MKNNKNINQKLKPKAYNKWQQQSVDKGDKLEKLFEEWDKEDREKLRKRNK